VALSGRLLLTTNNTPYRSLTVGQQRRRRAASCSVAGVQPTSASQANHAKAKTKRRAASGSRLSSFQSRARQAGHSLSASNWAQPSGRATAYSGSGRVGECLEWVYFVVSTTRNALNLVTHTCLQRHQLEPDAQQSRGAGVPVIQSRAENGLWAG
jgi:hypothetical protein